MNKARRKEIQKAIKLIEEAKEILEIVQEEEQEAYDNLPESIQYSEKGERMEENISILEEIIETLDTEMLEELIES